MYVLEYSITQSSLDSIGACWWPLKTKTSRLADIRLKSHGWRIVELEEGEFVEKSTIYHGWQIGM